jgi:hypothetical protein
MRAFHWPDERENLPRLPFSVISVGGPRVARDSNCSGVQDARTTFALNPYRWAVSCCL